MTMLYRPVGLHELALIWDSGMREFPPRLPQQPIFYPVANLEYATQIARDWNTKDNSFAGYVTKFAVADSFHVLWVRLRMSSIGFQPNTLRCSMLQSKEPSALNPLSSVRVLRGSFQTASGLGEKMLSNSSSQ